MEHLGSYFIQYENDGAVEVNNLIEQAQKLPLPQTNNHYTIVASRSHLSKRNGRFYTTKKIAAWKCGMHKLWQLHKVVPCCRRQSAGISKVGAHYGVGYSRRPCNCKICRMQCL